MLWCSGVFSGDRLGGGETRRSFVEFLAWYRDMVVPTVDEVRG